MPDVCPLAFTDLSEWEAAARKAEATPAGGLWFFKAKNAANSKGIHVARTVDEGRRVLAFSKSAGPVTAATFDDGFMERMHAALSTSSDADGDPSGGPASPGAPSPAALRRAFDSALCSDVARLNDAMRGFVVQQGVERPLLVKGGRKFCLRTYGPSAHLPNAPSHAVASLSVAVW